MRKSSVITGMVLIVLAIVLGAFGAHALKEHLDLAQLSSFETGVRYQIYHGIALLIIGLHADKFPFDVKWSVRLILIGVILFSGSIYGLSLQGVMGAKMSFLGPITPIGGVLMIAAWTLMIFRLLNDRQIGKQ